MGVMKGWRDHAGKWGAGLSFQLCYDAVLGPLFKDPRSPCSPLAACFLVDLFTWVPVFFSLVVLPFSRWGISASLLVLAYGPGGVPSLYLLQIILGRDTSGRRLGEVLSRWGGVLSEKTGSCQQKADFIDVLQVRGRILPLSSFSRLRRGPDGVSSTSLEPSPVTQEICTFSVLSKKGLSLRLHWFRSPGLGGPLREVRIHPTLIHSAPFWLQEERNPEHQSPGGVSKMGYHCLFLWEPCVGISQLSWQLLPLKHVRR